VSPHLPISTQHQPGAPIPFPVPRRYSVGKIPKAFKIIPNLKNWEDVLYMTDPDSWSPHAMYQVPVNGAQGCSLQAVCICCGSQAA